MRILCEIKAIRDETLQTSTAIRDVLAANKERWQWERSSWWFKWRQDRLRQRLEKSNPLRCAWPWTICDEGAVHRVRWDVLHERGFKRPSLRTPPRGPGGRHRRRVGERMKALTIRQPWADAIFLYGKDVENRSRRTYHRGLLAIHAASANLAMSTEYMPTFEKLGLRAPSTRPERTGVVLGVVEVVDCVQNSDSPWAFEGSWHWILRKPELFDVPEPAKGRLGLWDWE